MYLSINLNERWSWPRTELDIAKARIADEWHPSDTELLFPPRQRKLSKRDVKKSNFIPSAEKCARGSFGRRKKGRKEGARMEKKKVQRWLIREIHLSLAKAVISPRDFLESYTVCARRESRKR